MKLTRTKKGLQVHLDTGPLTEMQRLRWVENTEALLLDNSFRSHPSHQGLSGLLAAYLKRQQRICLAAYGSADS